MGWKERAEAYKSIGNQKGMRVDDFIARKLLRGIGWTEKDLGLLCYKLGLKFDSNEPIINTTKEILDVVSYGSFGMLSPNRKFMLDIRNIPMSAKFWNSDEILELCEIANSMPYGMIIFSEKSKDADRKCVGTVFLHEQDETPNWILQPTSILRFRKNETMVWIRDGEELIRDMARDLKWSIPDRFSTN